MRREVAAEVVERGAAGDAALIVVDVRSAAEYAAGHVPGAVNIPIDDLDTRRGELPAHRPVVAYCNLTHPGNARCERAADLLSANGHDAAILAGGFTQWRASGRTVATGHRSGGGPESPGGPTTIGRAPAPTLAPDLRPATTMSPSGTRQRPVQPSMLATERIVAFVATTDLQRAAAFYGGTLGLALRDETPAFCVFEAGGTTLRVVIVREFSPAPHTVLGWSVTDLDAVMSSLEARGVAFLHFEGVAQDGRGVWRAPSGDRVVWFRDPDGSVLSLTEPGAA